MDNQAAKRLITNTFDFPFNIGRYKLLSRNIFKEFEEAEFIREGASYIPEGFRSHIKKYERLGKYEDAQGRIMDILIVYINEGVGLDKARTLQRNFIANYLDDRGKDAALVAFTTPDMEDWRFSLITIEYKTIQDESGKVKTKKVLSNAKRFSFLVGKNEANHTAQQQIIPLLINNNNPSIEDLEQAFSVEQVTNEFYQEYKKRFLELDYEINRVLDKDEKIKKEFSQQNISTENFAKKLMGQIVFLYFVQKKGWLGVGKDENAEEERVNQIFSFNEYMDIFNKFPKTELRTSAQYLKDMFNFYGKDENGNFLKWGEGDKKFMRSLFAKKFCKYNNYFNDVLEPLFYEALATERANNYYSNFECKIPFLSGGLFEPINSYNWQETDITISNNVIEMILDTFDRYNFTVKEDDPLDKEVAIDPEMLGKVFENLLPENLKKGNGAYYTPRPIVHYMCQESLINYLDTHLDIDKNDITLLVKEGEAVVEHDKIAKTKDDTYKGKYQQRMPSSIIDNAVEIDKLLTYVKICDPAIGSGAFPMGLLHEIVEARNVLTIYIGNEQSRTKYHLKEDCIQHSIYGVDIDEGAIEISKLRLWLSLIVDENDIENIKPLPNLDYKIICGNSLISRYELDSPIDLVFNEFNKKVKSKDYNNKNIRDFVGNQEVDLKFYKKLTNDFLTESSHNKKIIFRELIDEIKNAFKTELEGKDIQKLSDTRGALANLSRINIFGEQEGTKTEINKVRKKLEKLEKQKQEIQDGAIFENAVEWRFEFPNLLNEDGIFTGFDIVIANPPYIGQKGNNKIFKAVKNTTFGAKFHQRRMDYFYFFFHKSFELTNDKAVVTFITTNYYFTATYADKLRNDIYDKCSFKTIVNFNEAKIFETAMGQHNAISILSKKSSNDTVCNLIDTDRTGFCNEKVLIEVLNTSDKETTSVLKLNSELFETKEKYIYTKDNPQYTFLNKLKVNVESLEKLCNVIQGIVTGADKLSQKHLNQFDLNYEKGKGIFVLSKDEISELNLLDKEKLMLVPWFKNSDISKWITNIKQKESLIYFSSKEKYTSIPNILSHFERFKPILINRNTRSGTDILSSEDYDNFVGGKSEVSYVMIASAFKRGDYQCISYARDKQVFEGEKIVAPQRSRKNTFGYNNTSWFAASDVHFITKKEDSKIKLKYVLALLNSKLYFEWLYHYGKRKGEMLELVREPLSKIPIKVATENIQQQFALLADKIINRKKNKEDTLALEQQVDIMACKLYELTYEEVLIVDKEFSMSEVEYNNFEL